MKDHRAGVAGRAAELKRQGLTLRETGQRIGGSKGKISKLISAERTANAHP